MSSPHLRLPNRAAALLGALIAVTIVAGCGGSSNTGSTAGSTTAAAAVTSTSGKSTTTTAAGASGTATSAPAHPAATGASAPTSVQPGSPSPGGRLLRRFTGSGNGRLGTIVAPAGSRLLWSVHHAGVQIFTSNGFMLVNSHFPAGAVRLSRGTYRGVRVSTAGSWVIVLRSASS
jgi:hypothetical protein